MAAGFFRASLFTRRSPRRRARLQIQLLESRRPLSADALLHEGRVPNEHKAASAVEGELIVGFKAGINEAQIEGLYRAQGLAELERLFQTDHVRRVAVPGQAAHAMQWTLENHPLVQYAEPNYVASSFFTPNDPFYSNQWHLGAGLGGINVGSAWEVTSGAGVTVAVLDTGIAYENYSDASGSYYRAPDLAATSFVPGYDFINGDAHANDDHSHGTHVAGTIAQSTDNARGVAGVAFEADVMPVKVLGADGNGSYLAIANGIRWSADQGADVINLSLGASSPSRTLEDALAYAYGKGATIVAAAGNAGLGQVSYPAAYDDYVIAVSATRYDEQLAPYSNYGSSIDLAAPGGDISVDQSGDGYPDGILQNTFDPVTKDTSQFGYYLFQGTSMAAPHVAGVAALVISQGVTDPAEVREVLQASARDIGPDGLDLHTGYGLTDAAAALAAIQTRNNAPSASDDTASTSEGSDLVIDVLSNDTDSDGDSLAITSVSLASNGTVTINADQTLTYSPDPGFRGSDSFTYVIADGNGGIDSATVTIEVSSGYILGDLNGDAQFNNADIDPFLMALMDPYGYSAMYPNVDPDIVADFDRNGSFENADISGFLAALGF